MVVVLLVVIGVAAWQVVRLRNQIHTLRQSNDSQTQQISTLRTDLGNLRNAFTATVACLESSQADKSLCLQFAHS